MTHEYKGIENELYLRAQLQHMVKNPSGSRAQKLEDTFEGISIDFMTEDFGEQRTKGNYGPIIGKCEELEF